MSAEPFESHPPAEIKVGFTGPAGSLEGLLRPVAGSSPPRRVALLCHPHPLFGGTMANKTLYRIARELPGRARCAALRFNFRGVGGSQGRHDGGPGEVEDARSALAWLSKHFRGIPIVAIGYSFGAVFGLRAAADHPGVERLVALGLPLTPEWDVDFLRETTKPRCFVQGEKDEFGPESQIRAFARDLNPPGQVHVVEAAGHLFTGREDEAVQAVVEYIRRSPTKE